MSLDEEILASNDILNESIVIFRKLQSVFIHSSMHSSVKKTQIHPTMLVMLKTDLYFHLIIFSPTQSQKRSAFRLK